MTTANVKTICPRDCYANCGLEVMVHNGKAIAIKGDKEHPYNRGVLCPKSRRFLDLVYSPQRLTTPLLKQEGTFRPVTWDYALDFLAEKLWETRETVGPEGILHYSDYAHSGLLHNSVDRRFFRAFGGCTRPNGSLCLSAGLTALEEAFGQLALSDPEQLGLAGTIILWGANPAATHVPLLPYLKQARHRGAKVWLIDPIRTETADLVDFHLAPNPGSDGLLAFAIAKWLIETGEYDQGFVSCNSEGFDQLRQFVQGISQEFIETNTGIDWATIQSLAADIGQYQPLSILPGFGLQRRTNGAEIIRAVANLVALTGSIGLPGGGVHYAHSYWQCLGDLSGEGDFTYTERFFPRGTFGSALLTANPEVKLAVINKANPLVQNPRPDLFAAALARIPLVVVLDLFLTPTAAAADLILPVTSFLEDSDLIYNSWHPYLGLSKAVIKPRGEAKSDPEIFLELGSRLGCLVETKTELLEKALSPLKPWGISLERLEQGPWRLPTAPEVAWASRLFSTPSGKYRFCDPEATDFRAVMPIQGIEGYPYTLLSPQPKERTHSQGAFLESEEPLVFYLHPSSARNEGLVDGQPIIASTPAGSVTGVLRLNDRVHRRVVLTYNGVWPQTPQEGLNVLISEKISNSGNQAAMYDCPCLIRGR